jgi:hypothetical protein
MSYPLSRTMSSLTAGYGAFALARPDHLGKAIGAARQDMAGLNLLARSYGVRDLGISSLGILGRSPGAVRAAMLLRIAMDLGDAALLSTKVESDRARTKVLAATLGWATLNTLALVLDARRSA